MKILNHSLMLRESLRILMSNHEHPCQYCGEDLRLSLDDLHGEGRCNKSITSKESIEMKEIEKIEDYHRLLDTSFRDKVAEKMNEIIDAVNMFIVCNPRIEERADARRDFERHKNDNS